MIEWDGRCGPAGVLAFPGTYHYDYAVLDRYFNEARIDSQILTVGRTVSVADGLGEAVPREGLLPLAPNPFLGGTEIAFGVLSETDVKLMIFDVRGRLLRTLVNSRLSRGLHQISWDGRDENGRRVPSGVYICQFKAGSLTQSRRIVKLK
ncbi:MAG: FlgD immunoglobulin-like domain containing protein [Candidatus Eisenbacteria bacterium]|nr:FlgD immunoglobulin-like domain containing protein [Candidatus Eisenbacteria bacterium]